MSKRPMSIVAALTLLATGCQPSARSGSQQPHTPVQATPPQPPFLPLRRLNIYDNGTAYFERGAMPPPRGCRFQIPTELQPAGDIINSLTVLPPRQRGSVTLLLPSSQRLPVAENTKRPALPLVEQLGAMENQLVTLRTISGSIFHGRFLGLIRHSRGNAPPQNDTRRQHRPTQPSQPGSPTQELVDPWKASSDRSALLALRTDDAHHVTIPLTKVASVSPDDIDLRMELQAQATEHTDEAPQPALEEPLQVSCSGPAPLALGYFAGAPPWQVSYGLYLRHGSSTGLLRGQLTLHNDTEEPWFNVGVMLGGRRATTHHSPADQVASGLDAQPSPPTQRSGLGVFRIPSLVSTPPHTAVLLPLYAGNVPVETIVWVGARGTPVKAVRVNNVLPVSLPGGSITVFDPVDGPINKPMGRLDPNESTVLPLRPSPDVQVSTSRVGDIASVLDGFSYRDGTLDVRWTSTQRTSYRVSNTGVGPQRVYWHLHGPRGARFSGGNVVVVDRRAHQLALLLSVPAGKKLETTLTTTTKRVDMLSTDRLAPETALTWQSARGLPADAKELVRRVHTAAVRADKRATDVDDVTDELSDVVAALRDLDARLYASKGQPVATNAITGLIREQRRLQRQRRQLEAKERRLDRQEQQQQVKLDELLRSLATKMPMKR